MDYYTFCIIFCIFFWVICAFAIVMGMAWVYIQIQYYRWDKEARLEKAIIERISNQTIEELESEQYDTFEESTIDEKAE